MNVMRFSFLYLGLLGYIFQANAFSQKIKEDTSKIDREYFLEATMLGYFAKDGTRNPVLKAHIGDKVRITITNGETMTHDIALEKQGIKSKTILEKGSSTSLLFKAEKSDTYFCSIPGHRAAGMVGKFSIVEGSLEAKIVNGKRPLKNGKALNLNFENGKLSDWTATGDAFSQLYSMQDSLTFKDKKTKTGHEGEYYISSGGNTKYKQTGTLTSQSFTVIHPFASFLVSGGALLDTRVEVVLAKNKKVIFKSTGQGRANLQPVVINLKAYLNQAIYIRIIDNETGISQIPYIPNDIWAHINFDDFRFYAYKPSFSNELFQKDIIALPPLDPVLHAGLSGSEAAKVMSLPQGFKIQLAAAEPDIIRPISFTIDFKGRLWVVEGHTYPIPAKEGEGKDRILIFEDTDGDGTLDSRKVFLENLNLVSGIEIGMGGVWLCAAPYLLFVPTDFTSDKPLGPPEKLLDGWGTEDTHEVLNNIRWGPDGWLYGVHGVFTHSKVGKPGTIESERVKINAGVWRYHPTEKNFEVFSEGTSNPWGIDFNDNGHAFITACVIPHMYHAIQGGRYERQAGKSFNPYTYDEIKTIADHKHYVGDRGPHAGNFRSAAVGGGHAHAGAMIYLGGNTWSKEYRNTIFMNNINGAKLNNDLLTRKGSGYVASHRKDFLAMNDSWSQWLNMKYDQNGAVYAIDWYDKNQCHSPNPDVHDKTMGRIFKISHEKDTFQKVDLSMASESELVNFQLHPNEWYVRQARTLLQERGLSEKAILVLKEILNLNPDISRKLRALWTLKVTNKISELELLNLLSNNDENIRAWAIQFLAEKKMVSESCVESIKTLAKTENSALVKLYICSALLRFEPSQRWGVVEALLGKTDYKEDPNLPLMLWYAAEPLADLDPNRVLQMAEKTNLSQFLKFMIQRVSAIKSDTAKTALKGLLGRLDKSHEQHENKIIIEKILNP
jgi:putative membrane-bound dehydrogenase-like protein